MENVLVRTPWKETWLESDRAGVETTKGWKLRRESDDKRVGRVMESEYGEDGKCVGDRCAIAQGGSCGVRTQGTTIIREREEPTVRWRRGIYRPCPASHRHSTATPVVNMGIIVKLSVALPCVKSHVSRTAGAIFVVLCAENVLVRTPWKET